MPVSEPGGSRVRSPLPEPDPTVWGQDTNWILQFDNVIKHPGGKYKGCRCDVHDRSRSLDSGTKLNKLPVLCIVISVKFAVGLNKICLEMHPFLLIIF